MAMVGRYVIGYIWYAGTHHYLSLLWQMYTSPCTPYIH